MSIRVKIIVALFLVTVAIALGATGFSYHLLQGSLAEEFRARLRDLAHVGAGSIDVRAASHLAALLGDGLSDQRIAEIEASADYARLDQELNAIRAADPNMIQYVYILTPTADRGRARFLVDADVIAWNGRQKRGERPNEEISHFALSYDISDKAALREALESHRLVVEDRMVPDPKYNTRSLSAYAPINDERGAFLGILGVDLKDQNMQAALAQSRIVSATIIAGALLAATVMSIFVGRQLTAGIRELNAVVMRFATKQFDARAPVRSADEVGNLSRSFNAMAETIETYARDLEALLTAYGRFVPHSFLDFLGKASIVDLRLGDHVEKEMTVLFSDIRSFSTLSESMTPQESFDFVNAFLRRVGPLIRGHGGVIDKYIGDAVMALFPGPVDSALRAAIAMQREVVAYNVTRRERGYRPIAIGVGLHTGMLVLGTVGEAERMNSTVISDNVNLASRLEGVTKYYGVSIVISGATLALLPAPADFQIRFLDKIQVKGKREPAMIYEVFDADPAEARAFKEATAPAWSRATQLYFGRRFAEALPLFREILARHPADLPAQHYVERTERWTRDGVPEDWDGVLAMETK